MKLGILFLGLSLLIASTTWLYEKSQLDYQFYKDVDIKVQDFYRLTNQLDQLIARQELASYPDYRPINLVFSSMLETYENLKEHINKDVGLTSALLFSRFEETYKEKEFQLLVYFEINSVLKNSRSYLLYTAKKSVILNVDEKIRLFKIISHTNVDEVIDKEVDGLKTLLFNKVNRFDEILLLIRHLDVFNQHLKKLLGLKKTLSNGFLLQSLSDIDEWVDVKYKEEVSLALFYKQLLYLSTIVLLLGLFLAVLLLLKNYRKQKQLNSELVYSEMHFSTMLNMVGSGIISIDSSYNITLFNKQAQKVFGYTEDEMIGRSINLLLPEMDREQHTSQIHGFVETNEGRVSRAKRNYVRGQAKDGHDVLLDAAISKFTHIDQVVLTVSFEDVTEKVQIQETMIQSEKMLSVGGLAAGMAHEINNPLAGIIQNLQVMSNRLSGGLKKNEIIAKEVGVDFEHVQAYIEKRGIAPMIEAVMESGVRAAKIVNNMLSFSRKGVGIRTSEDANYILDQTIELASNDYDLKKKYDFRKIKIVREYSEALPSLFCEASEIQQVFFNILKNATQAMMSDENKDKTEASCLTIRTMEMNGKLVIEIEDNGPGISEAICKRIFEPFFTTKAPGLGTGLGLSVSYFIVTKNHLGSMEVDSQVGKGTKFIIGLPFSEEINT